MPFDGGTQGGQFDIISLLNQAFGQQSTGQPSAGGVGGSKKANKKNSKKRDQHKNTRESALGGPIRDGGGAKPRENSASSRLDQLGSIGDADVGQVDVRTDFMRALEQAAAPLLFTALLNPQAISGALGAAGGTAPTLQGFQNDASLNPAFAALQGGAPQSSFLNALLGAAPQSGPQGTAGSSTGAVDPSKKGGAVPTGNLAGGPPVQFLQTGGVVDPTVPTVVGEAGPEVLSPGVTGTVTPTTFDRTMFDPKAILANAAPGQFQGAALNELQQMAAAGTMFDPRFGNINDPNRQAISALQFNSMLPGFDPGNDPQAQAFRNAFTSSIPSLQQGINSSTGQPLAPAMQQATLQFLQQTGQLPQQPTAAAGPTGPAAGSTATPSPNPNLQMLLSGQNPLGGSSPTPSPTGQQTNNTAGGTQGSGAVPQAAPVPPVAQPQGQVQQQTANVLGPAGQQANQLLSSAPEVDILNQLQQSLGGIFQQNPGQGVIDALTPIFDRNLSRGLGELRNTAPSVFNSGLGLEGTDLTARALQDFNLTAAQALQQGVGQQIQGGQLLGSLAGQAGQNPFGRALGLAGLNSQTGLGLGNLSLGNLQAGNQHQQAMTSLAQQQNQFANQFALAQNAQQFNQTVNPTLQLLLAALGMVGPTGFQTITAQG